MAFEELVAWGTSSYLNIGISTTAILLVLAAAQGRRGLKYAGRAATIYRYILVSVLVIGVLLAVGVITGVNPGRLVELVQAVSNALIGLF